MKKRIVVLIGILLVLALAIAQWWYPKPQSKQVLTLYGNVELRQVALAFNDAERIMQVRVEEGDVVKAGQVLAVLDTARLMLRIAEAQAQLQAVEQNVLRLRNGARPEEIAQARANLAAANAEAENTQRDYQRVQNMVRESAGKALSQRDSDASLVAFQMAQARRNSLQKTLRLVELGARVEDMAQAQAQVHALQAQLALLKQQQEDAQLKAPVDAVVRNRLMEPGEMASPQRPVLALAVVSPKWVRAYVSELDLGRIRLGMKAKIVSDSYPEKPIDGRLSFISPSAEFTPKMVQTEALRTALVYEVRILVDDPQQCLQLGMPVTLQLALAEAAAQPLSQDNAR